MKRSFLVGAVLLLSAGVFALQRNSAQETPDKAKAAENYKIPAADAARVNPIKASAEGLAEARKVFGYDCAMCHGAKGDGKGEIVESMKLEMHDWREPATLAGITDGELFYIITKGKGKMVPEGDRVPERLRWNLVNLVRALAAKGGGEQKSAAASPTS
jgi:mono/diheme cytochrome c family protein